MPALQLDSVRKVYQSGDSEIVALDHATLTVGDDEILALVGPSGSGKTTLLNIVSGLDAASAGEVRLDGDLLSAMNPGTLSRLRLHKIGFVFQSYNLIPVLTARENVEFTLMLQGVSAGERRRRAMDMLKHVGLEGLENRRPPTLSGGQQQRVAVARAIVTRPRLVLADEPTANLDSETGARLLDLMRRLNREERMTFVFSTHDPMVMDYARRLVRLHDGRIASDERRGGAEA